MEQFYEQGECSASARVHFGSDHLHPSGQMGISAEKELGLQDLVLSKLLVELDPQGHLLELASPLCESPALPIKKMDIRSPLDLPVTGARFWSSWPG